MSDPAPPESADKPAEAAGGWRPWLIEIARWGMWLLVAAGVVYAVWKARADLAEKNVDLGQIHYGWFAVSGGLYLLGTLPCALYWRQILWSMGQEPSLLASIRAYFIGHLGKYIPGKAMVVVIRANLLAVDKVDATVAAVTVFVETLTMMATGALLGAIVLLVWHRDQWYLVALAVGMILAAGLPTLPPIFRHLVWLAQVARANPDIDDALSGLDARTMLLGWAANVVGFVLLGLSYWAALQALPESLFAEGGVANLGGPVDSLPLLTGLVALAIVAGFVSFLPGGAGARELVLNTLMAPLVGGAAALLSAVALRLAWLVAEVIASIILYYVPVGADAPPGRADIPPG